MQRAQATTRTPVFESSLILLCQHLRGRTEKRDSDEDPDAWGGRALRGRNGLVHGRQPGFDRVVKKSPAEVYAAFSALAQQGTVTPPGQGDKGPRIAFRVDKVDGR